MSVTVLTPNPRWAEQFKQVATDLAAALIGMHMEAIEHVGSTSVPGLATKPTLDIDTYIAGKSKILQKNTLRARPQHGRPAGHPPAQQPTDTSITLLEEPLSLIHI